MTEAKRMTENVTGYITLAGSDFRQSQLDAVRRVRQAMSEALIRCEQDGLTGYTVDATALWIAELDAALAPPLVVGGFPKPEKSSE